MVQIANERCSVSRIGLHIEMRDEGISYADQCQYRISETPASEFASVIYEEGSGSVRCWTPESVEKYFARKQMALSKP